MREPTEAEMNAMIAKRLATMPPERVRGVGRPKRATLQKLLAGGKRMSVRQIAIALGTTTRLVHQVVCNSHRSFKPPWLLRDKPSPDAEYVYFLASGSDAR